MRGAAFGELRSEARRLLAEVGPNVLAEPGHPSSARRLLRNLVHLFAVLLWAGAALAFLGGMPELSAAIVVVILVNAVFATVQEHRAERAAEALRRMLPAQARVRRDGEEAEVSAEQLVPGDLLVLRPGDRVSADADVVARSELRVDNSTLTGESWPVEPPIRVYAGTWVASGAGEAVVTATGMATEFGRIAGLAQSVEEERSPLERELDHVTRFVAVLVLVLGAVFFVVAGALGMGMQERFVFTVGIMVANVPEGLLPTVTLSLALAAQRMARRNALVRRLSSVETLGETTVICTDKTGTLTRNEMTVVRVWTVGLLSSRFLLVAIAVELALAVALVHTPGVNTAFHQRPLGPWHWALLLGWAPLLFAAEEGRKWFVRRRGGRGARPYFPARGSAARRMRPVRRRGDALDEIERRAP